MKYLLKKGDDTFRPGLGLRRLHTGVTFAEWRGHFDDSTWYEEEDGTPPPFNQGSGWSFGRADKNSISWGWRPVRRQNQKMQEICLFTSENGIRSQSPQTLLLPLGEDFFVQLKTNGTFASLAARTFTGDWQMLTARWGARAKRGRWLGLALGKGPSPRDMAVELRRV